ncbi:hypothetical protein EF294_03330 [Gordonia oryzae]|uniref:Replicative helicase inhibitor G39P N-terminal domain-containing protein n=1 Tax=Gordonia oryzae TaxID=2487349 RepID=A0A3N4GSJ0_9ACTN|nr:hypothetical protein [Gordonia oryzae]RPA65782.1 hypothetical protein EF294_03330 [Gordonia oryzae]
MNRNQIIDLLTIASAYDRRTIGEGDIAAWSEASRRAGWRLELATDAIHEHYAQTSKWLMPGHITERIKLAARQPAPVDEAMRQLGAAPPASAERRAEVMAEIRKFADRKAMP